jgi:hypothetical protein
MHKQNWKPVPPKFVRRWAIQGRRPNGLFTTTIFDVIQDRQHVAVYPATLETFAVLIDNFAVKLLNAAAQSNDPAVVPAWHAIHGDRLLGLTPHDHEVMSLYVTLPKDKIEIVYAKERLAALRRAFADLEAALTRDRSVQGI